jgi:flavin reductase (DIM6/NTAB) family NADH-FMN oxidoreductase RutF
MKSIDQAFTKINSAELTDNFIRTIGDEWMLVTAGTLQKFNTMTASWGTVGVLWNKPIAICFIRPTRFTYSFINDAAVFTLSFFHASERRILNFCGSKSGRNVDKISETGLTPLLTENMAIGFMQSRLCIECRKIYADDLNPDKFLVPEIETNYPKRDYHRFFIGEIMNCYVNQDAM